MTTEARTTLVRTSQGPTEQETSLEQGLLGLSSRDSCSPPAPQKALSEALAAFHS